jgi:hypothetical protein
MAAFEKLSKVLFGGDVVAADIKTMPGTEPELTRDQLAKSLLDSMQRVGLAKDGKLVDPNR